MTGQPTALPPTAGEPTPEPRTPALPPSPPLPKLVQTWLLLTRLGALLRWCQRRYGDTFTVHDSFGGPNVILTNPEDIRAVFSGDVDQFRAGEGNIVLRPILGRRSVLVLDGDPHRDRRKMMLPAFHGRQVRRQEPLMRQVVTEQLAEWPVGRPFPAHERTRALALEIILRVVLGVREPARTQRLRTALPHVVELSPTDLVMILYPKVRRFGRWRRYWARKVEVDRLLDDEIRIRAADPDLADREDVLSALLRAYQQAGDPVHDGDLREQLLTLLLAGHETTATSLAWAFDLLAHNPAAQDQLIASVLAGQTEYAAAVATETLRIRPVIDFVARRLPRPALVRGRLLPAGVTVNPAISVVHFDPSLHEDPWQFRPERWLDSATSTPGAPGQNKNGLTLPFGGGPRRCLGAPFAVAELQVALEEVARRYRITPVSRRPERVRMRHITSVPARGARVVLTAHE